jgi:transcriptional regulator with XRE-family HTH domain
MLRKECAVEDLKPVIAKNITALRQQARMTQSELAERLNYSDKAISKWERAESMPDVAVLKTIADLFDVPLDYLIRAEHTKPQPVEPEPFVPNARHNHRVITTLSVLLVWFVATLVYVMIDVLCPSAWRHWVVFLYAVPTSLTVWLVFNSIWFNRRTNYAIISMLTWSALIGVVVTLFAYNVRAWQLLLLGIPGQIIIFIWSRLQYHQR